MTGLTRYAPFALAALLLATLAVILIYDCWISLTNVPGGQTASSVLREWITAEPVLVLLTGILLGHLFWTPK